MLVQSDSCCVSCTYIEDIQILGMNMPFISSSEAKNAYFMSGEATVEIYIFFASRDEINGIFMTKNWILFYYTACMGFRVKFVLALVSFLCYCLLQRHLLSIKFSGVMAYIRKRKLSFMTDLISWKNHDMHILGKNPTISYPTH